MIVYEIEPRVPNTVYARALVFRAMLNIGIRGFSYASETEYVTIKVREEDAAWFVLKGCGDWVAAEFEKNPDTLTHQRVYFDCNDRT